MSETYIAIMIQSLEKKIQVLDRIIYLDDKQKEQLQDDGCPIEEFDETVEEKSELLKQMELLDSGFEALYQKVREELQQNKADHKDKIAKMQELIHSITDKSVQIQAQEARNKELMTQKFTRIKKHAKNVRTNGKATSEYYRNMMQMNYIDPQFLDDKK